MLSQVLWTALTFYSSVVVAHPSLTLFRLPPRACLQLLLCCFSVWQMQFVNLLGRDYRLNSMCFILASTELISKSWENVKKFTFLTSKCSLDSRFTAELELKSIISLSGPKVRFAAVTVATDTHDTSIGAYVALYSATGYTFRRYQRKWGHCVEGQIMVPPECSHSNPETCEYVTLLGQRDFVGMIIFS